MQHAGAEEDVEVSLIRLGARYLHTRLGRWITADPLAVHGRTADQNPYAYVDGALFSAVDPSGLQGGPMEPPPPPIIEDTVIVRGEPRKKAQPPKDPPTAKVHINKLNLAKQLWKQIVVDTGKVVLRNPVNPALPREIADPILDFYTPNIEEEEGDISEWVAFGASLLIPGPGEAKLMTMGVHSVEQAAVHFGPRVAETAIARAGETGAAVLYFNAGKGTTIFRNSRFGNAFESSALSVVGSVMRKVRAYSQALKRITYPDAKTDVFMAEVKSGAEVKLTPQIAAQLSVAKEEGLFYYLIVNMQTQVAPEVLARISSHAPAGAEGVVNGMIVRFEQSTGKFFAY